MSLTVTIGGTDVTSKLARNSFSLTNAIGQRDTLALSVLSKDGTYRPPAGAPVVVTHSALGAMFGGTIRRTQTGLRGVEVLSALQCASWEQIFDRRLCGQVTYTDQPAGDVFTDLLTRYCGAEGVTSSIVTTGPNITVSFDFCTVREAFDAICQLATDATDTYMWDCTASKVLRFYKQSSFPAPIDVTEDRSDIFRNIVVTRSFDNYVNKVYVRLGKYITEERSNTYSPDGTQDSLAFEIPLAKVPTVTVDGVALTVGIRDVDTGKQAYWQDGSADVTFETAPASGTTVVITAQGYQSTVIDAAEDSAEITDRGTIEDNSGYYMTLIESSDPGTSADGIALGQAQIAKFGKVPYAVEYQTTYGGIKAGQHQRIALTKFGDPFDLTFIVESSTLTQENGLWSWRVRAINGALANNWLTKLRNIAQKGGGSVTTGSVITTPGGTATPPNNVTIGTVTVESAQYSPTGAAKGRRMVAKRPIAIAYTPPSPVGTFAGVYVEVTLPDDAGATPTMGGSTGLGTTVSLGATTPAKFGPFPFSETGASIRVTVDEPNWRTTSTAVTGRVRLISYSADVTNDSATSPSATFTVDPPSVAKPGSATAYAQNPTTISIPATAPDGQPNPRNQLDGGILDTHLWVHQDATDDPAAAGVAWRVTSDPDGQQIINASGPQPEADFELVFKCPTSIGTYYVWACGVDADGNANPIVPGITPMAEVTLGTDAGTVDLGAALSGTYNGQHFDLVDGKFIIAGVPLGDKIATDLASYLDVDSGVLKVKPSALTGDLVAAAAIDTVHLVDSAVGTNKLAPFATTAAKIANAAIQNAHLDRATVNKIAITDADIVNLSAAKITAGTLAAGVVYAGSILTSQISAGTLGAGVIYAGTINASQINAGTLGAGVVYAGTVNCSQLNAGTISAAVTLTAPTIQCTSVSGPFSKIVSISPAGYANPISVTNYNSGVQKSQCVIDAIYVSVTDNTTGASSTFGPNGVSLDNFLKVVSLRSTYPGAGSKEFWYDPATGNVKYAA